MIEFQRRMPPLKVVAICMDARLCSKVRTAIKIFFFCRILDCQKLKEKWTEPKPQGRKELLDGSVS